MIVLRNRFYFILVFLDRIYRIGRILIFVITSQREVMPYNPPNGGTFYPGNPVNPVKYKR
jgi:hypothetical protein